MKCAHCHSCKHHLVQYHQESILGTFRLRKWDLSQTGEEKQRIKHVSMDGRIMVCYRYLTAKKLKNP